MYPRVKCWLSTFHKINDQIIKTIILIIANSWDCQYSFSIVFGWFCSELYSEHIVEGYYTNSQCTLIVVTPGMVGLKIELKICMPSIRLRLSSTVNYSDKTLALNMLTDWSNFNIAVAR